MLQAGDGDEGLRPLARKDGNVDHTILLGTKQFDTIQDQRVDVGSVAHRNRGHVPTIHQLRNGRELALE